VELFGDLEISVIDCERERAGEKKKKDKKIRGHDYAYGT
jgi:hypothetical protein